MYYTLHKCVSYFAKYIVTSILVTESVVTLSVAASMRQEFGEMFGRVVSELCELTDKRTELVNVPASHADGVCPFLCALVTSVNCGKTDEPIQMRSVCA